MEKYYGQIDEEDPYWGRKRAHIPPLYEKIPELLCVEQLTSYLVQLRLSQIMNMIGDQTNVVSMEDKKYIKERSNLMGLSQEQWFSYQMPPGPKKLGVFSERIWIPADEHPEINFIGLILGPRGNELRRLEYESGARIQIRGAGSVREGRYRSEHMHVDQNHEKLHAYITANSEEKLSRAKAMLKQIIEYAIITPDSENEFKKLQLKELAELCCGINDFESVCPNCNNPGHRKYDCTEPLNENQFYNNILDINLNDDTTNNMDPQMEKDYQNFITELASQQGIPVIISKISYDKEYYAKLYSNQNVINS